MPQPHHQCASVEEVENPWCQGPEYSVENELCLVKLADVHRNDS